MMRLQRVGRKNDPSYRLVVVDKRTGPKSNKNIDILGSYNAKMNHVQIDAQKAKEWLSKGVQPSDTVHNILVSEKVIEAKKKNVLPKKSPIVDEAKLAREAEESEAKKAASDEADNSEAAKAEAEAETSATESEDSKEDKSTEEETPTEEAEAEAGNEASEEEKKDA